MTRKFSKRSLGGQESEESSGPHPSAAANAETAEMLLSSYELPQFPAPPSFDEFRPFPSEIDLRKTPGALGGMWHQDGEFCRGLHIQVQDCHLHRSDWKNIVFTFCVPPGNKSAFVISLHQPESTFVKELKETLALLLKHAYLKVKFGANLLIETTYKTVK